MKFYQFVMWSDCNHNCLFCKQKKEKQLLQKSDAENRYRLVENFVKSTIQEKSKLLLVGGELISFTENSTVIGQCVNAIVNNKHIVELQILTNLLYNHIQLEKISVLYNSIRAENAELQFVMGTSYDEYGRFHTDELRKRWIKNVRILSVSYPEMNIAVNVILTKQAVERGLKSIYDELISYGVKNVSFIPPIALDESWWPNEDDVVKQLLEFDISFREKMMRTYDTSIEKIVLTPNSDLTGFDDCTAQLQSCGHPVNFTTSYTKSCWACQAKNKLL